MSASIIRYIGVVRASRQITIIIILVVGVGSPHLRFHTADIVLVSAHRRWRGTADEQTLFTWLTSRQAVTIQRAHKPMGHQNPGRGQLNSVHSSPESPSGCRSHQSQVSSSSSSSLFVDGGWSRQTSPRSGLARPGPC